MAGNPSWWSMHPPSQQTSALLSSSPSIFPSQYVFGSSSFSSNSLPDNQELPQSWNQLLLGGSSGDEDRYDMSQFQHKKLGSWEDRILSPSPCISVVADVKQEVSHNSSLYGHGDEDFQAARPAAAWPQVMPVSSPRSCVTSLGSTNILDFSYNKADGTNQPPDQSSESNSSATGGACKKARVQPSSSSQPLKVRKEKLGDRITVLHQMVSPFGKVTSYLLVFMSFDILTFWYSYPFCFRPMNHFTSFVGSRNSLISTALGNCHNKHTQTQELNSKKLRLRGLLLL
ncbi:transcription factor bHLH [Salix suchowensis]|nr:transcription factor bHLH [Salix suchowensis]